MAVRFLPQPCVEEKTALSKTEMYRRIREGTFPAPVTIGRQRVAWIESEIDAWCEQRVKERDEGAERRRILATTSVNARWAKERAKPANAPAKVDGDNDRSRLHK